MPEDELDIEALGQATGLDPQALQALLMMGTGAATGGAGIGQQMTLQQALLGSAMDVTGRKGITGKNFSGILPVWAADIAPDVLKNPDFDPYFGQVSAAGDEMVYMGMRKPKKGEIGAVDPKTGEPAIRSPRDKGDSKPVQDSLVATEDGSEIKKNFGDMPKGWWDKPVTKDERAALEQSQQGLPVFSHSGQELDAIEAKLKWWEGKAPAKGLPGLPVPEQVTGETTPEYANPTDRALTVAQVLNLPYTWSEEKILETMALMRKSGINVTAFEGTPGTVSLMSVWGNLVTRASMMYSMSEGKRKVTPWDVLDMYKSEAAAAGTLTDFESGSKKTTHKTVANITEGQAWQSMQQTLSSMLGRDPSDQEVRDFAYRMNQLAAQNPSISTTVAKYKAGEIVSQDTVTKGGFDGADVMQKAYAKAQGDPDYAEYQASTTYFNAALSALGAIGDGG